MKTCTASGMSRRTCIAPCQSISSSTSLPRATWSPEPRRGRRVPVAVDERVLEELARGLERRERALVDEVVVHAVDLAGARRARRVGHRQPDAGLALEQRGDEAGLAAARWRGEDEQAADAGGALVGGRTVVMVEARSGAARCCRTIHSRFCTCSRICSISTFISSDACESSASTDFEPSVLASRCSSCIRKSSRLPALPPARARGALRRRAWTAAPAPRQRRPWWRTARAPASAGPGPGRAPLRAGARRACRR